jgi:hypothetical protein
VDIMAAVAERLEQVATRQPVFHLWWVVGATLESLRDGGLESTATLKRLLGQADRELLDWHARRRCSGAERRPPWLIVILVPGSSPRYAPGQDERYSRRRHMVFVWGGEPVDSYVCRGTVEHQVAQ